MGFTIKTSFPIKRYFKDDMNSYWIYHFMASSIFDIFLNFHYFAKKNECLARHIFISLWYNYSDNDNEFMLNTAVCITSLYACQKNEVHLNFKIKTKTQ